MAFEQELPLGWRWSNVEELRAAGRSLVSGPFGSNIGSRFFVESGVPVIRGNNLTLGAKRFIDAGFVFLTTDKAAEFPNCIAESNDLIFTAAGTIGQVGIVPERPKYVRYVISNKQLRARFDESLISPLFAYYWLSSPLMVRYIQSRNTGSTIPLINLSVLRSLPVPLAPLQEQKEIVGIIDSLDRKISHLEQTNDSLEAIARAIFKSWFVDFDPVRAKADGREPEGMDAATAALFPSEFQDSELGPIPHGWRSGQLSEIVSINPPRTLRKGQAAPYLDMSNVPTTGPSVTDIVNRPLGSGCKFVNGDTLLAKITPCLENGKTAFVDFLQPDEVGWGSTELIVLAPVDPVPSALGYLLARDPSFRSFAEQSMTGTSGRQRVPPDQLKRFGIVIAESTAYQAFGELVAPMFQAITANAGRVRTLSALRDALLPRLISGKLRVPEVEAVFAETL